MCKTLYDAMKAKPFVKWVGGKGQLIEQLEALLPADFDKWENVTYIEPFVGGGAMLFHMLQKHNSSMCFMRRIIGIASMNRMVPRRQ